MRTETYNVFLQTYFRQTKIAARQINIPFSRWPSRRGVNVRGYVWHKRGQLIIPLEKRIKPGEDTETSGDDLELELLILSFVDFLPGVVRKRPFKSLKIYPRQKDLHPVRLGSSWRPLPRL